MAIPDTIVYQSVLSPTGGLLQQITNLRLTGISTIQDSQNTDNGKLFGSLSASGSTYTLDLYSDSTRLDLVASAQTSSALPIVVEVVEQNDSGISGFVNFQQFEQADPMIEVVALFSVDKDLTLANMTSISDYDPTYGFATFHTEAFEKIKEIITSRYKSKLFNPALIDTRFINGGVGGFDLSKVLTWEPLRMTAAYYAMYRIAERQGVSEFFAKTACDSRKMFKAYLESVEIDFAEMGQRVETSSRAGSTFKVSRT